MEERCSNDLGYLAAASRRGPDSAGCAGRDRCFSADYRAGDGEQLSAACAEQLPGADLKGQLMRRAGDGVEQPIWWLLAGRPFAAGAAATAGGAGGRATGDAGSGAAHAPAHLEAEHYAHALADGEAGAGAGR